MSAITGFLAPDTIYVSNQTSRETNITKMAAALQRRGPDHTGFYFFAHGAFAHAALNCNQIHSKIATEEQPCTKTLGGRRMTLLYDGAISNLPQLQENLSAHLPAEHLDTQEKILLGGFFVYGPDFITQLRGSFALALYDESQNRLFLFRDPLGLKPLFYLPHGRMLLFASEPKGILAFPSVCPSVDREGFNELFAMGPAHSPGKTLYKNLMEVKPGHYIVYSSGSLREECYHHFCITEHTDSYEDTLDCVHFLLEKSLITQSDVSAEPASLLSGGLDSSVITAWLCQKRSLKTFSFDFLGSKNYFTANRFQPSLDAPFVHEMVDYLGTDHTTLVCGNAEQFTYLHASMLAHDAPAMADVDSSMLYFCEKIAPQTPVVFSGECADELFCGYPWYHNATMSQPGVFPWSADFDARLQLLNDDLINMLCPVDYVHSEYDSALACLDVFSASDDMHALTMFLTMRYFMQTLVDRADRIASHCSMDLRVPFADFDLAEYLFHVPYSMKAKDGDVKHLLREFARGLLPDSVRTRRKSPYPKTYDPGYEAMLVREFRAMLANDSSPLLPYLDFAKVERFLEHTKDYGKPWYGQLMAGPQLLAYYLQINDWLKTYSPAIDLS